MKFKNYYYLDKREHFSQFNDDFNIITNKKIYFGKDTNSDPYYIEKKGSGDNHHLRITINDDSNESLQIWGNSCNAPGGCGGDGLMQHKFDSLGNVEHKGALTAGNVVISGTTTVATPTANNHAATKKYVDDSSPIGTVIAWHQKTGQAIPYGWALCNGSIPSAPFQSYGNTPDLRERFILGGSGTNLRGGINTKGGEKEHTLTTSEMPSHTHTINNAGNHHHSHNRQHQGTFSYCVGGDGDCRRKNFLSHPGSNSGNNTNTTGDHNHSMNSSGGNQSHNNMPPYYVLVYIIKVA